MVEVNNDSLVLRFGEGYRGQLARYSKHFFEEIIRHINDVNKIKGGAELIDFGFSKELIPGLESAKVLAESAVSSINELYNANQKDAAEALALGHVYNMLTIFQGIPELKDILSTFQMFKRYDLEKPAAPKLEKDIYFALSYLGDDISYIKSGLVYNSVVSKDADMTSIMSSLHDFYRKIIVAPPPEWPVQHLEELAAIVEYKQPREEGVFSRVISRVKSVLGLDDDVTMLDIDRETIKDVHQYQPSDSDSESDVSVSDVDATFLDHIAPTKTELSEDSAIETTKEGKTEVIKETSPKRPYRPSQAVPTDTGAEKGFGSDTDSTPSSPRSPKPGHRND